jgi:hypothetical protein
MFSDLWGRNLLCMFVLNVVRRVAIYSYVVVRMNLITLSFLRTHLEIMFVYLFLPLLFLIALSRSTHAHLESVWSREDSRACICVLFYYCFHYIKREMMC